MGVLPLRTFWRCASAASAVPKMRWVELGVVSVSHPNNPALAGVDTGDGAHLYPAPVRDVGGGSHEGIAPPTPSSFFSPPPPASFPPPSAFFSRPFSFGAGTAFDFGGGVLIRGGGLRRRTMKRKRRGCRTRRPSLTQTASTPLRGGGGLPPLPFLGRGVSVCRLLVGSHKSPVWAIEVANSIIGWDRRAAGNKQKCSTSTKAHGTHARTHTHHPTS